MPPVASTATTAASATLFVELTPSRTDGGLAAAMSPPAPPPASPAIVRPLAPERYRIQFTASPALVDKLRRVQDLLRHTIPSGDPALVFERALTVLLAQLERATFAAADRPRRGQPPAGRSRHIAAAVRRAVWVRDSGQCTFLQFHHLEPHALGGEATVERIAAALCGAQPLRGRAGVRQLRPADGTSV